MPPDLYTDYAVFAPQVTCPYCGTILAVIWEAQPATGTYENIPCANCGSPITIQAKLDGKRQGRKYKARQKEQPHDDTN